MAMDTVPSGRRSEGTPWGVWAVWAGLAGVLVMNALAVWLPLAGRTTGEISDRFPILLTPAGYAFSVWSVIYAGLLGFAAYQTHPRIRGREAIARLRLPFVATCVFNVAWLVAWHNLWIPASSILIAALWFSLAVLYRRTRGLGRGLRSFDTWLVAVPFGLYFGWLTVATLVNLRVLLYDLGWTGGGGPDLAFTVAMLALVTGVAASIAWRWRDLAFAGAAVWALVAVALANGGTPTVAVAAWLGAAGVAAIATWRLARGAPRETPA